MKYSIILISLFFILVECTSKPSYNDVGDIVPNVRLDNSSFTVCDEYRIKQYYLRKSSDLVPSYGGEKKALDAELLTQFVQLDSAVSGYVTVRFVLNCKGETGRFRVEEMGLDLKPKSVHPELPSRLIEMVHNLNRWTPRTSRGEWIDTYHYLTFKIEAGKLTEILP